MGCDDSDVEVVDDHEYWGVGVAAADADVVEFAVVSQGDFAAGVDVVVADAVLGAGCGGGCGFGELGVDVCGHCACDAAVGSVVVVGVGEVVELVLELVDGVGAGLGGEPFFEGLLESFDFAAGGGVVWSGVFLFDAEFVEQRFEAVA